VTRGSAALLLDVEEQASRIETGELSALSLVRLYLNRIERLDPALHAYVDVFARRARLAARAVDRRLPGFAPGPSQPAAGIPLAIKDLNAVRGTFMRMGSRAFKHLVTPRDDRVVARLRAAGFIMLGKTSTPELGILPLTEPLVHPATRNPWDVRLSPGGSSGGSAAAVAAGLASIALGSDAGGSIRIPSSFCGLVGFKPSRGAIKNPFGLDSPELIWSCGPIARSVRDAAFMVRAMAERPPFGSSAELESAAVSLGKLRVRWTTASSLICAEPEIAEVVQRVAGCVARLGHDVSEGAVLSGTTLEEFLPIWQRNAATAPVLNWAHTEPFTRWLGVPGKARARADVAALTRRIAAAFLAWFGDADIWLTPTVALSPPRIGSFSGLSHQAMFEASARLAAFTAPYNVTGQPALTLPVALSSQGLPIGVQIAGRRGADGVVLALARRLEQELPWVHSAILP
jgi:amidase